MLLNISNGTTNEEGKMLLYEWRHMKTRLANDHLPTVAGGMIRLLQTSC